MPHPVVSTLFAKSSVHTLDGDAHRHRRALFVALLMEADGIEALAKVVGEAFDETAETWRGGDPRTDHRCPGEKITIALLDTLAQRLARLDYHLPPQDLSIDLSRIPARPASGVQIAVV